MRQIGTVPTSEQAETFRDFLLVEGIGSTIDNKLGGFSIWIHDEDQLDRAREAFREFQENPQAARFQGVRQKAESIRNAEIARWKEAKKKQVNVRDQWERRAAAGTPLTWFLVLISVVVTLATQFGEDQNNLLRSLWIDFPSNRRGWIPLAVREGEVWRLFSPAFLHLHPLHLLFNMLWLFQLGREIESREGTLKYFVFVLLAGVISNLAQYYETGYGFGGMSGVVYALFGYVWIRSQHTDRGGYYLDRQVVVWMMIWFAACFTGLVGNIANSAHAAGLIVGILAALPQVARERWG